MTEVLYRFDLDTKPKFVASITYLLRTACEGFENAPGLKECDEAAKYLYRVCDSIQKAMRAEHEAFYSREEFAYDVQEACIGLADNGYEFTTVRKLALKIKSAIKGIRNLQCRRSGTKKQPEVPASDTYRQALSIDEAIEHLQHLIKASANNEVRKHGLNIVADLRSGLTYREICDRRFVTNRTIADVVNLAVTVAYGLD